MSLAHNPSCRVIRWLAFALSVVLVISCLIQPIGGNAGEVKPPKSRSGTAQRKDPGGNGKEKRVPPAPPQPGAPQLMLPDLETERQRERPAPQAPAAIGSTIRARRKPLESRGGRKVGDRLRPRGRSHHASRVRRSLLRSARSEALTNATAMTLVFTNDPLTAGIPIKAIHITELRDAIDGARVVANLSAALWAEAIVAGETFVKASHITEMRLRLDEARGALGLSTGGYADAGLNTGYDIKAIHIQQLRGRVRQIVDPSSSDGFVQNFLEWGLGRASNGDESNYWADIMRAAHPQGQASRLMAAYELGMTVFDSAEYAGRNRTNQQYVSDLYHAYLRRAPETCDPNDPNYLLCGPAFWANACNSMGRAAVRKAFDDSIEFHDLVAAMTTSGAPSSNAASLATARVDLFNQSGNQTRARDCEWSLPLVSLPGRAGLDLGVSLSYSSLVWTRSGPYVYFNPDNESLSPGFTIGFPSVQWRSFDAQTARNVYLLTAAGRRTELRQVGTSNVYESADSSYLQLIDYGGSLLLRTTDGTQMSYSAYPNGWQVTEIKDRNGNLILVNNDWRGDILSITDTLGRVIDFHYDGNANLNSITQTWNGASHTWATFGWGNHSMANNLSPQVVGTYNGETIPVLTQVSLHDGSRFTFGYTANGQVNLIRRYATPEDVSPRSTMAYDYQGTDDCPRIYQARVAAENWTGVNGVPGEVVTSFSDNGDTHQMVVPDGTVYSESYGVGWKKGLVIGTEVRVNNVPQKWTTTAYTQDNTGVNYQTNPRVTETNVFDNGNRRRTTIDYSPPAYVQFGLPYFISEYAADGATEIRRSYTDYNLSQTYLDHRIIGLVSSRQLYDPASGWQAKTTYTYDSTTVNSQATTAPGHDQSYNNAFTARGNLTQVARWDVADINNASKALTTQISYDAAGNVLSTADPSGHANSIGYGDSFSDGNNSRGTFAYPTTVTDADGHLAYVQFNYDFGARTRTQNPLGAVQAISYDGAARVQRVTTTNTGAYTHYVYGPNYLQSYSSVNTVAQNYWESDLYSVRVFDGVGRVFAAAGYHPGSSGGYKAQWTQFDAMGRALKQSNPTEITGGWAPAGDDIAGVVYTQQTYDWQGRPLYTTNTDGTQKYASYSGCGCAGGEMVTLTDEVGRQQKVYSDVLGRQWKSEVLNWNGSVYSTTTNTLNALDQITNVRQTDNATGGYQDTVMTFDGYGRLASKHVPEQNAGTATVYTYKSDDTLESVTDARGASATYGYNNRHLATSITYSAPSGITPTANVTLGYDAAGNRTSMTDGAGSGAYVFDQLSRLTSESRTFTGAGGPSGTFTLSYQYNLTGQLKKITDPTNATINYDYDNSGRVTAVTGENTLVENVSSYASNLQYRAWGALKEIDYGNSTHSHLGYNARLLPTSLALSNVQLPPNYQSTTLSWNYDYLADGRNHHAYDVADSRFDRAQEYDHVGRLKETYSGREAIGLSPATPYPDSPYRQTMQYDVWGNMTAKSGRFWRQTISDSFAYTNNRGPSGRWQYDAEGNMVNGDAKLHFYDAANQQTQFINWSIVVGGGLTGHDPAPAIEIAQSYNGDNQPAKRIETRRTEQLIGEGPLTNITESATTTFYLYSSVLSAKVVELNSSGHKLKAYVYLNGQVLATQEGYVTWRHPNAGSDSWVETTSARVATREEMDPVGAETGVSDPYQYSSQPTYDNVKGQEPLYIEGGDPFDYSGGCTMAGMPISCSDAAHYLASGLGQVNGVKTDGANPRGSQNGGGSVLVDETLIQLSWISSQAGDGGWSPGEWRLYRDTISKYVSRPFVGDQSGGTQRPVVDPSTLGEPPRPVPVYCYSSFIEAMKTAWAKTSNGRSGSEAGFVEVRMPIGNGITASHPRALPYTNQKLNEQGREHLSFDWEQGVFRSVWHTHSRGGPPSDVDRDDVANKYNVPIYSFGPDGLWEYKPGEKKATKVRNNMDWTTSCRKKPPLK